MVHLMNAINIHFSKCNFGFFLIIFDHGFIGNKTDDLRGEVIVPPSKKLEDLIHLTELCVDLLQQNEEHYAEVSHSIIFVKYLK